MNDLTLRGARRALLLTSSALISLAVLTAGPAPAAEHRDWFKIEARGQTGVVFIYDVIRPGDGTSARSFMEQFRALKDVTALEVHINSPGGVVYEGQAIYNLLKQHKAKKTVFIDGMALSIASLIAMAGDKIIMPENTVMMIHNPSAGGAGTAKDFRKAAENLDRARDSMLTVYQARTKVPAEELRAMLEAETWFSAREAVAKGFADEIGESVEIAASFDLSDFTNVPADIRAAFPGIASPGAIAGNKRGTPEGATMKIKIKVPGPGGLREIEVDEKDADRILAEANAAERKRVSTIAALPTALGLVGVVAAATVTASVDALIEGFKTVEEATAELQKLKPAAAAAPGTPEFNAAVTAALGVERQRIEGINALVGTLRLAGVPAATAAVGLLIKDGATIDAARAKLIDIRAAHEEANGPIISFSGNGQTFDNPEFRRDALATAFAHRAAPQLVKLTDPAKQFAHLTILGIALECVRAQGHRVTMGDRDALIVHALHSSSDFPLLLGDVTNKLLLPAYEAAAPTYRAIAAQKTFNDFKAHKFLRLGDFPDLLKVGESGEVKLGTISESRETVTLYSYGRRLAVNRQMLINDDLSAFTDLASMAGIRVANFENAAVYTVLTSNPALADTVALFHSTHANYTSSGTAVNLPVELGKSRALMRKQTGLDGVKLNLAPMFLVVGPDNETAAEQVTTQTSAQQASTVNKIGPSLKQVTDANITDYRWYLFANPALAPVLIWGSLPGQSGPRVMTKEGWSVEGVEIKVMRDFGTGAIDHRGATLNAGTAPS